MTVFINEHAFPKANKSPPSNSTFINPLSKGFSIPSLSVN